MQDKTWKTIILSLEWKLNNKFKIGEVSTSNYQQAYFVLYVGKILMCTKFKRKQLHTKLKIFFSISENSQLW